MKLSSLFIFLSLLQLSANVFSQKTVISLRADKSYTIKELFQTIEDNTTYRFFYNDGLADLNKTVAVAQQDIQVKDLLDLVFDQTMITFRLLENDMIVVAPKKVLQQATITGVVTDDAGESMPGVNVIIRGTTTGVVTDINGRYSISVANSDAVLVFSFVGYVSQEITAGQQATVNVALTEDIHTLEEVVVVGYGTLSRSDVTAAVSKVKIDNIEKQTISSIDQVLQGQSAGVQVSQVTGTPGGGAVIRIRGAGSIGAGDDPLYVIDGFPITSGYDKYNNPLAMLGTDDIESITVLKDASSTSIYGSRGANGVILITTKRAKKGVSSVEFSGSYGLQKFIKNQKSDMMNAEEYAQFRKEDREDRIRLGQTGAATEIPEMYQDPAALGAGTDWFDEIIRVAPMQNYALTITKGKEDIRTMFSAGYMNQEGIIKNTGFERFSVRANVDANLGKRITAGLNLAPTLTNRKIVNTEGHFDAALLTQAYLSSPIPSVYQEDGSFTPTITSPDMFSNANPLNVLENRTNKRQQIRTLANVYLNVHIIEGLNFKSTFNVDYSNHRHDEYTPSTVGGFRNPPPQPAKGYYERGSTLNWLNENTLDYNKKIGDHKVNVLLGYTMQHEVSEKLPINAEAYADDDVTTINGSTKQVLQRGSQELIEKWSMISYLARVNYVYKDKYLVNGTVRTDGSSRFGKENRWATFPSVSLGWRLTNEGFFPQNKVLTDMKLRASWGKSGNNSIGNYTYLPTIGSQDYVFADALAYGKAPDRMANYLLGWELSEQVDIGFDAQLFNSRLSLEFDLYSRKTTSMLQSIDVPRSSGYGNVQSNIGNVENKGIEIGLSAKVLTGEFKWNSDFNISVNRNKVKDIGNRPRITSDFNITVVGQPMGMFYGYNMLGVYMNPDDLNSNEYKYGGKLAATGWSNNANQLGTSMVDDYNEDNKIDTNDKQIIGNPNPKFSFGFSNTFRYKNFDLFILMQGAVGHEIFDIYKRFMWNLDGPFNVLRELKDRYRSPEQPGNGMFPTSAITSHTVPIREGNSAMVSKASYLAVRNINLGYTFKIKNITDHIRPYISIQNPFIFSSYKGNPEVNTEGNNSLRPGINYTSYPTATIYSLGVNVKF